MKLQKYLSSKFLILCLAPLLFACQTSSNFGSSPLIYTEELDRISKKYVYNSGPYTQYHGTAIALNPETGRMIRVSATSGTNPNSLAQRSALKKCGEGCYIFAINNKIVWKGLDTSIVHKVPLSDAVNMRLAFTASEYNPIQIILSPEQQNDFLDYKSEVAFSAPYEVYAFAVSRGGASGFGKGDRDWLAEIEAKKACEALSFGAPCYLYAIDDKIVGEYLAKPDKKSPASLIQKTVSLPKKPISTPSIQHYKPELFELITSQFNAYGDYLSRVIAAQSNLHFAFAVSDQGHVATAENYKNFEAQLDAIRNCEAIAIGSRCYLYAVNKKILHKI